MRTSKLVLGLVVVLCAARTAAADPDPAQKYPFDLKIPMSEIDDKGVWTGSGDKPVEAGPIVFEKIWIDNRPTEQEIREDTRGKDRCRPKPMLVMKNVATFDAAMFVEATLEDENGKAFLTCRNTLNVDAGDRDEDGPCKPIAMYTSDWPKVKVLHLSGVAHKH